MNIATKQYLQHLDTRGRLRFLAHLALNLGVAARAEYPTPDYKGSEDCHQLRAFNEIYQEIAQQLVGELEATDHSPLEVAVAESMPGHATDKRLKSYLDWAVNRAIQMVDRAESQRG